MGGQAKGPHPCGLFWHWQVRVAPKRIKLIRLAVCPRPWQFVLPSASFASRSWPMPNLQTFALALRVVHPIASNSCPNVSIFFAETFVPCHSPLICCPPPPTRTASSNRLKLPRGCQECLPFAFPGWHATFPHEKGQKSGVQPKSTWSGGKGHLGEPDQKWVWGSAKARDFWLFHSSEHSQTPVASQPTK